LRARKFPQLDQAGPLYKFSAVTAKQDKVLANEPGRGATGRATPAPPFSIATAEEIDLSLLEDSLAKTPWERMQANDDALHLAEILRSAMRKRHAKA
jgi:hypothetical protein